MTLTPKDIQVIMRRLDDGYRDRKDYPAYAIAPWEDRNRYRKYVEAVLIDIAKEQSDGATGAQRRRNDQTDGD